MSKLVSVSLLTVTCLYGLLVILAVGICLVCGVSVLPALIGGIIVLILQFFISPWLMDLTTKWLYKADFNKEIPDYLKKFITEVCEKNKIKYPRIGIIDDGAPNCYTYGRTKKDARIIITRGVFDLLKEDEVKAVIGHELGHIAHYDMLVMTMAQLIPLVFYAIYEACIQSDDDDYSGAMAIVSYILYIISQYIVLWLSRTREYLADSFSVEETKNPNALAEALVKIGFGLTTGGNVTEEEKDKDSKDKKKNKQASATAVNGLGIFDKKTSKTLVACSSKDGMSTKVSKDAIKNAMKWEKWNYWAKWYELNSTHPLISKRLEAITKKCKEYKQEPYIVFDLKKDANYGRLFAFELLLVSLPVIAFITGIIFFILFLSNDYCQNYKIAMCVCGFLTVAFEAIIFFRKYKKNSFKESTVEKLLGETKVSSVTPVSCVMKGNVIGRGDPGYVFSEDFVIRDKTGIMFLDYKQPLWLINKIFAFFKAKTFIDKEITVTGWYRRSPVPYVEIFTMEMDGKKKKVYTYYFKLFGLILGVILFTVLLFI